MKIRKKVRAKYTSRVMDALARALDVPYNHYEQRCGVWGTSIGNIWDRRNGPVADIALHLLHVGAGVENWRTILLDAKDSRGFTMFEEAE